MNFLNILGLYALLALVPFIIIYLIRPRPAEKTIPSIMFLIKERALAKQRAFLQRLIKNIVFLLQLLVLIGLGFAVAQPFITTDKDTTEKNTVLVIDVSGSSNAKYGSITRFEQEIKEAKNYINGRAGIITAGETSAIITEDSTSTDASAILPIIRPKATISNIGDAMILAGDMLGKKEGNIIVFSDFIANSGSDVIVTKRSLEARGFPVTFVSVYSDIENMGIVNMELDKQNVKVYVRNYNDDARTAKLQVVKDNNVVDEKSGSVMANSVEIFDFQTPGGISKIQLSPEDGFNLDNDLYISAPESRTVDVWLITNLKDGEALEQSDKKNYLKYDFLTSALTVDKNIKLFIAKPPIIDQTTNLQKIETINPSVIIIHEVKEDFLPGAFDYIRKLAEKGTKVIITAQDDMSKLKFDDIMPVVLGGKANRTDMLKVVSNEFTKDVEFIGLDSYYTASLKDGAAVFAEATADKSPIIAQAGNVIYYGIIDSRSGFKTTTSYPIFWSSLIKSLVETENIADYNFVTGKIMVFQDDKKILKPSGYVRTNHLLVDEIGIYEIDNYKYAVNMLNEQESDVSKKTEVLEEEKAFETTRVKEKARLYLEIPLIVIALLLMITELLLIKFRGDI